MKIYAKIQSALWKNFKFFYYIKGFLRLLTPRSYFQRKLKKALQTAKNYDAEYLEKRVSYYIKLKEQYSTNKNFKTLANFKYIKELKNYFFDTYQYSRYFADTNKIAYAYGDVIHIPNEPAIVKSRPIAGNNENSVLLKLDKVRHFVFVNDKKEFTDKKFKLLWRGNVFPNQLSRIVLLNNLYGHPLCDIGCVNDAEGFEDKKAEKLMLYEHLDYQFILMSPLI